MKILSQKKYKELLIKETQAELRQLQIERKDKSIEELEEKLAKSIVDNNKLTKNVEELSNELLMAKKEIAILKGKLTKEKKKNAQNSQNTVQSDTKKSAKCTKKVQK